MSPPQCTPYQVPQSLWGVIELRAPTVELPEIKYIIGDDIIEQSTELFEEIYLLLDIWQQEAQEPRPVVEQTSLPESPYLREQTICQIQQFIKNLDATKNHLLQSFINERKTVYDYAQQKRPGSATSLVSRTSGEVLSGRLTPSRPDTGNKSTSDLSQYRDNISAFQIGKIVEDIRAAFRDEHRVLQGDIHFLNNAIEDLHDERVAAPTREPTLSELKTFANQLEERVMNLSQPAFTSIADKRPSSPKLRALPKHNAASEKSPKERSLPMIPSTPKLSWRQRTLKKVSIGGQETPAILKDINLRGGSPSGSRDTKVTGLLPRPPPPRSAFQKVAGTHIGE